MRKLYILPLFLMLTVFVFGQTNIDLTGIDEQLTTTFEEELVLDVATTASTVAEPALSLENPFQGGEFTEAEISFDVYNYGDIHVLGALFAIFDAELGRMYFTNGSYLGYNAIGGWFDANMIDYGIDTDFISTESWKNIKLQFTQDGFAMFVDNELAFNESSTDVTINTDPEAPFTDYSNVISFLQQASSLVFGTGSWWSDNSDEEGNYYDVQLSYMKNITFTPDFSTSVKQFANANAELIKVDYYNTSGVKTGTNFQSLNRGLYIKKETYSNGKIQTSKIIKVQ
jgi:hypothetical protein